MRVYFDNASTTSMTDEVVEVMCRIFKEDFGNPSSIHWHGRKSKSLIEQARKTVAKTINASLSEVFFTSCATEANNMVLKNAVEYLHIKRIITSPTEHHCVLHTVQYLAKSRHIEVIYLHVDHKGNPDTDQLANLLEEESAETLVSLMHGNNEIGTMIDLQLTGEICKKYKVPFHCDAVQTIGKYPIDIQSSNISFLSASAHKFHGPKGIGFVYISNDYMLPAYIHGGAQERNMRAGTENVAAIAGLEKALEVSVKDMDKNYKNIINLRNLMKQQLSNSINDISFNGNQDDHFLAHILSVSFPPGPKTEMLVMNLDINGISVSSGSACSAGIEEDSHVIQAIKHPKERKTIRFSFSPYNTIEELNYTIEKLKEVI
ncbi:MAG: cysteine desulfurase family protein [Saprospiraceae bacterium]